MSKLLLFMLLIGFMLSLFTLQTDEELAMHRLFDAKHALNRATHAAAQQTDLPKLSQGDIDLDEEKARAAALLYLRENLRLDDALAPLPGTFLQSPVEILALDVIGADHSFPYLYQQPLYDYSVTLNRPGVILIVKLEYPRMYRMMNPVTWVVKSSSELVI